MTGEFASMRRLSPEMHEGATKLVAEAMASATLRLLEDADEVRARLLAADPSGSCVNAFLGVASDFLDIRGDLTEWVVQS